MRKKVGIIGGGASGMMAAVTAAGAADVTILEHTARIGKKILSTGNGKCNYTNRTLSKDDYYCDHPSFVAHALSQFDDQAASAFFAAHGMLTSEKRDGYCYPYTGQAATVLNVLRMLLEEKGVTVKTEQKIEGVTAGKDGFIVKTRTDRYRFDKLILACGGNAAPQTGSDGSGYALAKSFGHTLRRPYPALTYLLTKDPACKELAGVRANALLTLYVDGEKVQMEEDRSPKHARMGQVTPLPSAMEVAEPVSSISKEQKLQQFEQMMRDMITSVVEQQTQQSEERIAEAVTEKVSKQMDYLMREKEELQQKQIEILEKILIEMRPAAKEAAATEELPQVTTIRSRKKEREAKRSVGWLHLPF